MTLLETADMLADVLGIENVYAGCIDANQDKLDISSVIDGINADNSTYLNTSKVVIDGTSQTINAKFTELTASIGSIGTRTSALESDLSGFRTTVSETYATKSTVDNIQIGGRNIVTGTADAVIG